MSFLGAKFTATGASSNSAYYTLTAPLTRQYGTAGITDAAGTSFGIAAPGWYAIKMLMSVPALAAGQSARMRIVIGPSPNIYDLSANAASEGPTEPTTIPNVWQGYLIGSYAIPNTVTISGFVTDTTARTLNFEVAVRRLSPP
jgi:hypothetical protein